MNVHQCNCLGSKQVFYPSFFEGTWSVQGRLKQVTFPQGEGFLRKDVPGVTKSSMLAALPDVGAGMESPVTYQCRFSRNGDDIIADRFAACSLPRRSNSNLYRIYRANSQKNQDDLTYTSAKLKSLIWSWPGEGSTLSMFQQLTPTSLRVHQA